MISVRVSGISRCVVGGAVRIRVCTWLRVNAVEFPALWHFKAVVDFSCLAELLVFNHANRPRLPTGRF